MTWSHVVATAQIVLGDKDDPDKTADLNAMHAVDLAELGANEATGGDTLQDNCRIHLR